MLSLPHLMVTPRASSRTLTGGVPNEQSLSTSHALLRPLPLHPFLLVLNVIFKAFKAVMHDTRQSLPG